MEILKDNYSGGHNETKYYVVCPRCTSEFRVEQKELDLNHSFICPLCGHYINAHESNESKHTNKKLTYPDDFFNFYQGEDVPNDVINDWVQNAVKVLQETPLDNATCIGSGNTIVFAYRNDDDIVVNVCKDYAEGICDTYGNIISED